MAGAHQNELAALQRAASRPKITDLEIETLVRLAEYDAINQQIAATPAEIKMERGLKALEAIKDFANAEARRASTWAKVRMVGRRIAVLCAGFPKERATDELKKFNAFERGRIYIEIDNLIADLRQVQKCMNGGDVPQADKYKGH